MTALHRELVALVVLAHLVSAPAFAQNAAAQCAARSTMMGWLADKYQERARGMGVAANGTLMELFASDLPGRTWSITITAAAGVMCIVASGNDYAEPAALAPQGDSA